MTASASSCWNSAPHCGEPQQPQGEAHGCCQQAQFTPSPNLPAMEATIFAMEAAILEVSPSVQWMPHRTETAVHSRDSA
jgi:hypothetical protein